MNRADILSDEYVRPKPDGLRIFSVGILKLCRKLGLSLAIPKQEDSEPDPERADREMLAVCWLLDERHSIGDIKAAAHEGPSFLTSERFQAYEFEIEASLLIGARAELSRANQAAQAIAFTISGGDASTVTRVDQTSVQDPTYVPVYAALSPAVPIFVVGGNVSGNLAPAASGTLFTASAECRSRSARGRRGQTFKTGAQLVCDGGYWYEVKNIGGVLYAVECERTIADVVVGDSELFPRSRLQCNFQLFAKLAGNATGRCEIVGEIGQFNATAPGANLSTVAFTTLFSSPVFLSPVNRSRTFTIVVSRSSGGALTGSYQLQGQATAFVPPSANLALRLRLTKFDAEDVPDPRGSLSITMRGASASIASLS